MIDTVLAVLLLLLAGCGAWWSILAAVDALRDPRPTYRAMGLVASGFYAGAALLLLLAIREVMR